MSVLIVEENSRSEYMHIVLYTLSTCPICEMIKKKMKQKDIYYEELDFSLLSESLNIDRAPVMAIVNDINFNKIKDNIIPIDAKFILSPTEMVEIINSWE